jgi:hypothetical protein
MWLVGWFVSVYRGLHFGSWRRQEWAWRLKQLPVNRRRDAEGRGRGICIKLFSGTCIVLSVHAKWSMLKWLISAFKWQLCVLLVTVIIQCFNFAVSTVSLIKHYYWYRCRAMTYLSECCLSVESKNDRGIQRKNRKISFCVSAYVRQRSIDFPSHNKIYFLFSVWSFWYSILNMFVYDLTIHVVSRWISVER